MESRHVIAISLATVALVAAGAMIALGLLCGVSAVDEPCESAAECAAQTRCVSSIHPTAPFFLAFAMGGVVGAWRRSPVFVLASGLLAFALGTLFLWSVGAFGLGTGAFLLAAGWVAPGGPRTLVRGAAVAWGASILGVALSFLTGLPPSMFLVWAALLGPIAVWFAYVAWVYLRPAA